MIDDSNIRTLVIEGEEKTAIRIGEKEDSLPGHIFQGEKHDSLICKDGTVRDIKYGAIYNEGIERYVYFDKMEICSLEHIASTHRGNALKIIRNLAIALESADKDFLNLETGVFPLYRIFIYEDDGVFLLSPDIGDVLSLIRRPEEKNSEVNALIRRDSEDNYRLIAQMGELLYYAATGALPYISDDVRLYKYQEFPLSSALGLLSESLDEKTLGFINLILHAKRQEMRDIMGNRSPAKALSWFISRSEMLKWNLGERKKEDYAVLEESEEYKSFSQKAYSGAKRNTFFRKKGTMMIVALIVVAFLSAFLYDYVSALLEPPVSAGEDQEGVVMSFYEAQNSLMLDDMLSAVKKTDVPQETEVMTLYVTSRMRMAYEAYNPMVDIDKWVDAGMPDINPGAVIYGVTDIELERIDEDTIAAHSVWYTPYSKSGDIEDDSTDTENPTYITIYENEVTQVFDFTWNDRGWWNITGAKITEFEEKGEYRVDYIMNEDSPMPQGV